MPERIPRKPSKTAHPKTVKPRPAAGGFRPLQRPAAGRQNQFLWDVLSEELGTGFIENRELHGAVRRLSRLFTEERENLPDYLSDKTLKNAYLAYYVPLNFAKVKLLLDANAHGLWQNYGAATGVNATPVTKLRWVDLGCGPGTAILAALDSFDQYCRTSKNPLAKQKPEIEIDLIDTSPDALVVAERLVKRMAEKLRYTVHITTSDAAPSHPEKYDLALAANVLNELPAQAKGETREPLLKLWDQTNGALVVLEPGHRVSSQRLIRFRERLLKDAREKKAPVHLLAPCPHEEKCPLYRSKHWCHFSDPVTDSRLLELNIRVFKDPRAWLKYSYVVAKREQAAKRDGLTFRAIGDLHQSGVGMMAIDLCQPNEKYVYRLQRSKAQAQREKLVRGAIVTLTKK